MIGDGNGWACCDLGHRHWGRFGAAGLLVSGGTHVLLQHRAGWTHEGDTWAVPGGALDSGEDAITGARREVAEETSLDPATVEPFTQWVDDHGGWSYTTILARTAHRGVVEARGGESDALQWWPLDQVAGLRLHHGFAATWPTLRALLDDRLVAD